MSIDINGNGIDGNGIDGLRLMLPIEQELNHLPAKVSTEDILFREMEKLKLRNLELQKIVYDLEDRYLDIKSVKDIIE